MAPKIQQPPQEAPSALDIAMEKSTPEKPVEPSRLTIQNLMDVIAAQRSAWSDAAQIGQTVDGMRGELRSLNLKALAAQADDDAPVAEVAKRIAETKGQAEVAGARIEKTEVKMRAAFAEASMLSKRFTSGRLSQAIDALREYRIDIAANRIAKYLCSSISAARLDNEKVTTFIQNAAYRAACLDSSLDDFSELSGYHPNIEDHSRVAPTFEKFANYVIANAEEIDSALAWQAERAAFLVKTARLGNTAYQRFPELLIELPRK